MSDFNNAFRQYSRRSEASYIAIGLLLGVSGLVGGLGVPSLLASLSLELARRLLGRKAPSAFAQLTSTFTATTHEAALIAQIRENE